MTNSLPSKPSLFRSVASAGLIITSGNFLIKILAVFSTIIVLRQLSIYEYGLWQLALATLSFVSLVTLPSTEDLLITDLSRELGRDRKDIYKALFKQSSLLIFLLGALAFLILFFSAPLISSISGNFSPILKILAFSFFFNSVFRIYLIVFYSHLKFIHTQGMKIINRLFSLLFIIILVAYFHLGLVGIAYAYLFSYIIPLIIYLPAFLKTIIYLKQVPANASFSFWRTIKAHGKWSIANNYVNTAGSSLRPWITGYFLGTEAVALIALALRLITEVTSLVPVDQILSPIIPREVESKERFRLLFERGTKYLFWFNIFLGIAAFLAAPHIIQIIAPKYLPSIPLFNILLLSLPFLPFATLATRFFYALKAQKLLLISTIIPKAGFIIGILPVFLYFFGLAGAVFAQVINSILTTITRFFFLKKASPAITLSLSNLFKFDRTDQLLVNKILTAIKNRIKLKFL